jgi:hypothetical protein
MSPLVRVALATRCGKTRRGAARVPLRGAWRFARTSRRSPAFGARMQHDPPHEPSEVQLAEVLEKAAIARRVAREFSHDRMAGRLEQYADELMAEAERIEADIRAARLH